MNKQRGFDSIKDDLAKQAALQARTQELIDADQSAFYVVEVREDHAGISDYACFSKYHLACMNANAVDLSLSVFSVRVVRKRLDMPSYEEETAYKRI